MSLASPTATRFRPAESGRVVAAGGGVAAAGSPRTAEAAAAIVSRGGTAVDAVITASAVQCVVELTWCGLSGDAFLLVHPAGDGVVAVNDSGAAPHRAPGGLDVLKCAFIGDTFVIIQDGTRCLNAPPPEPIRL